MYVYSRRLGALYSIILPFIVDWKDNKLELEKWKENTEREKQRQDLIDEIRQSVKQAPIEWL